MKKLKSWQISVAGVSMVLGILLALQFQIQKRLENDITTKRVDNLVAILKEVETERDNLKEENIALRNKSAKFEKQVLSASPNIDNELKQDFENAKLVLGKSALAGPGLIITLDDSLRKPKPNEDPMQFLIHDKDLQTVTAALWSAGAEAISINGERLITFNGKIECAGPTIMINGKRMSPPFEIRAIGNAKTMQDKLEADATLEVLRYSDLQVNIAIQQEIAIPAYNGKVQFLYAKPVKEEKK